ncbi:PH domain-containing protein [Alkalihalobacterium alkalinitrilicum]|uniref:PH domain-containing protein n=1 Tax=Alkalihalobacterium alkalinitrilicum TaxID=427920 RepID=UPI001C585136|nr:PH domain-containing protein [Alkalihalobacterium alkalinitrilicum]
MNKNSYRLHWSAIFISFFSSLKHLIVPILFGLIFGTTSDTTLFGTYYFYIILFVLLLSLLHSALYWLTFRYEWVDGELRVIEGVFVKKRRYIRVERVQSVDLSSGIIQRMFGLVSVKIETAGGGNEPEVYLIAISEEEGIRTRNFLLQKATSTVSEMTDQSESERVKSNRWVLSKQDLAIASMTSSGVGIVLTAVIAFFPQIEQLFSITLVKEFIDFFLDASYLQVLLYSFFILALAWLISILITIIKYGNFSVEKVGNELTITRGLLEKRQLTIQTDRVTAVRIVRNIFRQPFGYSAVYVESKGGGTNEEQRSTVLFPLIRQREINNELAIYLPQYIMSEDVIRAPKRSLLRFQLRMLFWPVALFLTLTYYYPAMIYFAGVLLFLSLLGYLQYRDSAVAIKPSQVMLTYRILSKSIVLIRKNKVQSGELASSPMQRIRSLTTVRLSVLSSIFGKTFSVRDLDLKTGQSLLTWLSHKKKE